jgi:hypothetical protein
MRAGEPQVMPRVTEANEISKELARGVRFETKITPVMTKAQGMVSMVMVRVVDGERDMEWLWDKSKFINRVYLMREMYEKFENGELVDKGLNDESDPFWDPNEPVNIGYCSVLVKPLSYCLSVEDDYALYREAHQDGILHLKLDPCGPDGAPVSEAEEGPYDDVEDPRDLIGRRYDVLVSVVFARGINKKYDKEVFIRFEVPQAANKAREDGAYQTPTQCDTSNPDFNFKQQITWPKVSEDLIRFFETGSIVFQVWGLQRDALGQNAPGKKFLTISECEALQKDFGKLQEENTKLVAALGDVQARCVGGAAAGAMSGLLQELAHALQEVGVDVSPMMELASTLPVPPPPDILAKFDAVGAELQSSKDEILRLQGTISTLQLSHDTLKDGQSSDSKDSEEEAAALSTVELKADKLAALLEGDYLA